MPAQATSDTDPLIQLDQRVSAVQARLASVKQQMLLLELNQIHRELGSVLHELVDIRACISEAKCERAGLRMQLRLLKEDSHG